MDAFFRTNGGTVAPKEALLLYRELAIRILGKTVGAYQKVTESARALHELRLDQINEALNMFYK